MTLSTLETITQTGNSILDSFLALSTSYLRCSELLSDLNASAVRSGLADCGYAAAVMAEGPTASEIEMTQSKMGMNLVSAALAYGRGLREIGAEAHGDLSRLMQSRQAVQCSPELLPDSWLDALAALSKNQRLLAKFMGGKTETRGATMN